MSARDLIRFFSEFTTLPVQINDIVDHLVDSGCQDEICFIGVDFDINIVRGFIKRYIFRRVPYGDPVFHTDIYYDRRQGLDWRRIVCCKELIHILDNQQQATSSREDVAALIERIVLPLEVRLDGLQVIEDRIGILKAIALLLPLAARELLLPRYKSGDLTDEEIAILACVPLRYVRVVMLDTWESLHEKLLSVC
jgi:hypothetical protein